MKPLFIFDLDGTLADISHRLHFIQRTPKDWRSFFAACFKDKPIQPTLEVCHTLYRGGADVWIWTGRSDEVYQETVNWLFQNGVYHARCNPKIEPRALKMRKAGDHSPDTHLKRSWLYSMTPEDRVRLSGIYEDRASVVQMWRSLGVQCFQVSDGDF